MPLAALVVAALTAAAVTLVAVAARGGVEEQRPVRVCFATGSGPCAEMRTLPPPDSQDIGAIERAAAKSAGAAAT